MSRTWRPTPNPTSLLPDDPIYLAGEQAHYDSVGIDMAWRITAGMYNRVLRLLVYRGILTTHPLSRGPERRRPSD